MASRFPPGLFGCGPTASCPQLRAAAAGCGRLRPDCYDTVCKPSPPPAPQPPNLCDLKIVENGMFFNRFASRCPNGDLRAPDSGSGTEGSPGCLYCQSKRAVAGLHFNVKYTSTTLHRDRSAMKSEQPWLSQQQTCSRDSNRRCDCSNGHAHVGNKKTVGAAATSPPTAGGGTS